MEREEAIEKLKKLVGKDLFSLAKKYGVTTWNEATGKQNKGWFGHVIEHILGLPMNSSQAPNFGSWELKTTSLKVVKGKVVPKETIAVTMIDKYNVIQHDFFHSHLYSKLQKEVIVARIVSQKFEDSGLVYKVAWFDLNDKELLNGIKRDYDLVRKTLRAHGKPTDNDLSCLSGKMGVFVQPRTKGAGHGSTTRAFYMRKGLVAKWLGIPYTPPKPRKSRKSKKKS